MLFGLRSDDAKDLSLQEISFLTFQAVLEVVIICLAGFFAAKSGLLNSKGQKVLSQLNVDLFTPCLVFTKLAPLLSFQKMADIVIIPLFYAVLTGIAYMCSRVVGIFFGLNDPESDFVTAMAVFGNSNSLPVSLTMSLAYTLPDLLWDDLDDDTPDKVASRGILYLLIFQQLGQILRWSWGYNKLLRKRSYEELHTYYNKTGDIEYQSVVHVSAAAPNDQANESTRLLQHVQARFDTHGAISESSSSDSLSGLAQDETVERLPSPEPPSKLRATARSVIKNFSLKRTRTWVAQLPVIREFLNFMNPPLYAMLVSVIIASVPALQNLFFNNDKSFVKNTLTSAIMQLGLVSIPLILIVLGSNLYPSRDVSPPSRHYTKIVVGSLLARMILPSFFLLPIIAFCVKFINISILDDPIFLIVAFVLTISPPAIQLSQITQLNDIYQREMAGVLFWGYVVLTLPTAIFIVTTSLEVLKWAGV